MGRGLFVLGAGRRQGTSLVTRGLLLAWRRRGLRVAPLKPIELGCPLASASADEREQVEALERLASLAGPPPLGSEPLHTAEFLRPRQAQALLEASGLSLPLERVSIFRYAADLEPLTAARLAGRPIEVERVVAAAADLRAHVDLLLVEGCGGPAAPLAPGLLQLDLVARLGLPVLLVLASTPGALNLGLLALESLTRRGCPLAGVVLSRPQPALRHEEVELPLLLEQFAGDLVRGVLPHFTAAELADSDHLARRFAVHLDLDRMLQPSAALPLGPVG